MNTSIFPPHHLIHHTRVALDDLHHFCAHILLHIIRHRDTIVPVPVHLHRRVHSLQKGGLINAGQDKAGLVQGLWPLRRSPNAHSWEWMPNGSKVRALLRQCARVRHYSKSVHLEMIVIMKSQRLMSHHSGIQFEPRLFQSLSGTWMARIKDGHIILFGQLVNGCKKGQEILLCIDILLSVGGKGHIFSILHPQLLQYI